MILLIHPPVTRPSEPPAGLARLSGCLSRNGIPHTLLDANLEGLLDLLSETPGNTGDPRTDRAARRLPENLQALRTWDGFGNAGRYRTAVHELNRLLEESAKRGTCRVALQNCADRDLSPVRSADLMTAFESPERNPFYPYFRRRLLEILDRDAPSLVGFSLNYLSQGLTTFAMMGFLRKTAPGVPIALGGGLVTSWTVRPGWNNPFAGMADHLVSGPGEGPLLSLAGKPGTGEPVCLPDLNGFPRNDYLSPGLILPYSASTGCYWNRCSFCPERAENRAYRPLPRTRVLEEIGELGRTYEPLLIHFVDNALGPSLLGALAREGSPRPWYGFARVTEELADPDFVRQLRKSGCVMLKLGIESGNQDVLDSLDKGIRLETASRALSTLHRFGIVPYAYFLFGTPGETEERALDTLDFIARHGESIGFLNLALFNLPAHGPETETLRTRDFYAGDLALYQEFEHPSGWHRNRVRNFLDRTVKRHPAVAAILRREPPSFGSNHAPLFAMTPTFRSRNRTLRFFRKAP
jgi:hypothetical protein